MIFGIFNTCTLLVGIIVMDCSHGEMLQYNKRDVYRENLKY
jgi:hypothetical protein